MRSRYSAFCVKDINYIKETTDPQMLYNIDWPTNEDWMKNSSFIKLEVLKAQEQGNKATVEFKAHFKMANQNTEQVHHEISKFRKHADRWYYREGKNL